MALHITASFLVRSAFCHASILPLILSSSSSLLSFFIQKVVPSQMGGGLPFTIRLGIK
jgi:hypothetical protein